MSQPADGSAGSGGIGKEQLLQILKKLLESDPDLGFLRQIDERSLEQLVAAVRSRIEKGR